MKNIQKIANESNWKMAKYTNQVIISQSYVFRSRKGSHTVELSPAILGKGLS
jgi:hypothetical protein